MSDGLDPILQQKEQQQLKTQLLWRLGIAGGLIGAILFGISWLDQKDPPPTLQTPHIAPELVASEMATATPSEAPTPSPAPSPAPTPNETTAATEAAMPLASATLNPAPTTAPSSKQSTTQKIDNVPIRTNIPTHGNNPEASKNNNPTAIPQTTTSKSIIATAIPFKTSSTPSASIAPPARAENFPKPVSNSQGYSVQAGVFLHANNAEKLLGQLQQAGIPAYLETRVQIGPFKNKAEADAAIKKLKTLGITPVLKTE